MRVSFIFLTRPVHIPPRSRQWPSLVPFSQSEGDFTVTLWKPVALRDGTHEIASPPFRVTDARIPIVVTGDWDGSDGEFDPVLDLAIKEGGRLLELLRIEIRQPILRLRGIQDLTPGNVVSPEDSTVLLEETRRLQEWFEQKTDRPLPFVDKSTWAKFTAKRTGPQEQPSLHESLLLDAEISGDADPRIAILYSALACEVFIETLIGDRSAGVKPILTWIEWARNPDSAASIHTLYDLGLRMIGRRSLKEAKGVYKKFATLIRARNDIAHRGKVERVPGGYTAHQAVAAAREVIAWVESSP